MAAISRAPARASTLSAQDAPRRLRRLVPWLSVLGALTGIHVAARQQDVRHASPLLLGEWLFTLALACAILVYAAALGRKLARPLLGIDIEDSGVHEPRLAAAAHAPQATAVGLALPSDRGPRPRTLAAVSLDESLIALALGYGALSQILLVAGLLRLYYAPIFLVAALALTMWLRDELRAVLRQARVAVTTAAYGGLARIPTTGQRLLALVLLAILIPVALRDTIPVTGDVPDWDGVAYHLSAPRLYVDAHRLIPVPDIALANAPSGADIFSVIGFLAQTDTLAKTLNLLLGLLFGAATFAFARRHAGGAALIATAILFTQFWAIELLPATVPDYTTAFFMVLGVSDACAWLERRNEGPLATGSSREHAVGPASLVARVLAPRDRLLVRAGLLLGFSVSCKLTSVPAVPAVCLAVGVVTLIQGGDALRARLLRAVRGGAIIGLCSLLPLALWLLKSAYFFGNPLYPQGVTTTTVDCTQTTACSAMPASHASHLWWMASTFAQELWHFASPLSVVLILAPFLLRRAPQRAALLFVAIGGALWLEFVPLFNPPRYWLGLIAVADVLIAATLCEILRRLPLRRATAELPLIAYLAIQGVLALSIAVGLAQRSDAVALDAGSLSRYDYLAARVRPYQAFAYVNSHVPAGAVVATVHTTLGYYLDRRYLNDWYGTRYGRLAGDESQRRAELAAWCSAGVRYAVFNRGSNEYNVDALAGLNPLATFAWIHEPGLHPRVLFSARGVDVLALTPCGVAQRAPR